MKHSLVSCFEEIPDFRGSHGRRYELAPTLTMITMALMSDRVSLREIGTFMTDNRDDLCDALHVKPRVPSYVTVRTIMRNVSLEHLNAAFNRWAHQDDRLQPNEILSFDGKALGSTVTDPETSLQNFACIVSAYCQRRGTVLGTKHYNNAERSEVAVVRELIEDLDIHGAVITADALHSTKKRSRR
jgi:hypothetical protein